jgi:hypothetical protein
MIENQVISYTEEDVTVTTTCTITVGESSQEPEPVVDDSDASFTPTLKCFHSVTFNPNDGSAFRDYQQPQNNSHSYLVTTQNSLPIYTSDTRTTIAGYAIPVPATAKAMKVTYPTSKTVTYLRFVDSDLQFIGEEVRFPEENNVTTRSYDLSNLSKHPKWLVMNVSSQSYSTTNGCVLTFE